MPLRIVLLTCGAAACAVLAPARAAESLDACVGFIDALPAVIATQGTWCLRADLATAVSSGNAITVAANNVTIDCNGYKIGGLAAGPSTMARGIVSDYLNTSVRRCTVRGFHGGISLSGAGGNTVEDNRLEQNTRNGMTVGGDGAKIARNQVLDTGGTPGSALVNGIVAFGEGSLIEDNQVVNLTGGGYVTGIQMPPASSVRGNLVSGLVPGGSGVPTGISGTVNGGVRSIRDNTLYVDSDTGIGISAWDGACSGNHIHGFATAMSGCASGGGNVVL